MKTSKSQPEQLTVFKQIREKLGITQFELAVETGISLSTIQRAESGQREPALSHEQWRKFDALVKKAGLNPEKLPNRLSEKIAV